VNKLIQKYNIFLILLLRITWLAGCMICEAAADETGNDINANLVMEIKSQLPQAGTCGIDSATITHKDCATSNKLFYNGRDSSIAYILKNDEKWPDSEIKQLLSEPTTKDRYRYYTEYYSRQNLVPTLQCDKVVKNLQQGCKVALFGNHQFQIDYLLCPELENQYLILTSNDWTPHLEHVFISCAANGWLKNQCQSPSIIAVTTPDSLKVGDYFTFTSRELCLLTNDYGLNLNPEQSQARYNVFTISK